MMHSKSIQPLSNECVTDYIGKTDHQLSAKTDTCTYAAYICIYTYVLVGENKLKAN